MKSSADTPSKKPVYFPGFNAVRLLAATVVIIHHVEQLKFLSGLTPHLWKNPVIHSLGVQGVNLFFVLSGFLITYLVCEEKQRTGTIAIGRFYTRRALKILPLYLLVTVIAFVVAPLVLSHASPVPANPVLGLLSGDLKALGPHIAVEFGLFVFMLPHVALLLYPPVMFISQAWSVGVEEHFYLIWPWLLKIADNRLLKVLLALIVLKLVALQAMVTFPRFLSFGSPRVGEALHFAARYLALFRVECMAIGGVAALIHRNPRLRRLVPQAAGALFTALVAALAFGGEHTLLTALVYAVALFNLASLPERAWLRSCLEQKHIRYLGNLSYGLYMYHPIAIVAGLVVATSQSLARSPLAWNGVLYGTTLGCVALLSIVSFHFLESPLLRLKQRFGSVSASISEVGRPTETDGEAGDSKVLRRVDAEAAAD